MGPHLRRMRSYRPRQRKAKNPDLSKQMLRDLEHRLSSDVSSLILLIEQGNAQQIETAKLKVKSDFLKHADEMQKIAQTLGERYVQAVSNFLNSIDPIIHAGSQWVDQEKIRNCYQMTQALEKEISAA